MPQDKLIIIDSNSLIHRAYHALPPLASPKGVLVNAVYGFLLIFLKTLAEFKPKYIVATFDSEGPTFRHQEFKEYKAQRKKLSDNFYFQIELIKKILNLFQVFILEKQGYEADDLIGFVSEKIKDKNIQKIIVTGDLDTLQLINENTGVYTLRKSFQDNILYNLDEMYKKYQLTPEQWIDYKALKGDASDNIPGVPGIGDKTAFKLLEKFLNIENLYKHLNNNQQNQFKPLISDRIFDVLKKYQEQAFLSKKLVTIEKNIDIDFALEYSKAKPIIEKEVEPFLNELGFRSLLNRLFQKEKTQGEANNNETKNKNSSLDKQKEEKVIIKITKSAQFSLLLNKIKNEKTIGVLLDFEGKKIFQRNVKGLGFIFLDSESFYLSADILADFFALLLKENINFTQKNIITHQGKILYQEMNRFQVFQNVFFEDIEILSWLIDSSKRDYSIPVLSKSFLKINVLSNFDTEIRFILPIWQEINKKIDIFSLNNTWQQAEKPLIPILASMEKNGINLDLKLIEEINKKIINQIQKLETEIYNIAEEKFNINSPLQVQKILFDKLKIPTTGLSKTPTGKISTNNDSLLKIINNHQIGKLLINYRELTKLKNSFLDTLPEFFNTNTNRLHTIWKQTATATGRLSSELPNLQNIPLKSEWGKEIRKSFIAEKGFKLVAFDYSQIELRLAAYLSQDPQMIKAFLNDLDIHCITASLINNVSVDKVTETMRNQAKALNFGILYGMGYRAFAQNANISFDQAKNFRQEYFNDFIVLKNYLDSLIIKAKENNYAETIFGRKRFLPLIGSSGRLGKEEERMALNMPIQGLAADIMKMAMIKIYNLMQEKNLQNDIKILLQVHDELILEVKSEIIEIIPEIKQTMESIIDIGFPLKTEVKIGNNWGEMNKNLN